MDTPPSSVDSISMYNIWFEIGFLIPYFMFTMYNENK